MSYQAAWSLITSAQKITLLTHHKPDADGVSACTALDLVLRKLGKTTEAIYPSKLDTPLKRQPALVHIQKHDQMPDLLIACDTANYERLYYPEAFRTLPLINIDHHISNSITGTVNIVNGQAASTCEEVYHLLMTCCPKLMDAQIAECLLFGILYDTQVFRTQSTTPRTLAAAQACLAYGSNIAHLARELFALKQVSILPLWGDVLQSVSIDETKKTVWAVVKQCDLQRRNLQTDALEGIVNLLAELNPLDVSILCYEAEDGSTKLSFRSKERDVNALAKTFGGGGHRCAAGASVKAPIDEVVKRVVAAL